MSTTKQVIETGRRRRRRHSAFSKAEAVGACQQPGVSVAAVALARGLNANMLRNWVRKAERSGRPIAIRPTVPDVALESARGFCACGVTREPDGGHHPHCGAAQGSHREHRVAGVGGARMRAAAARAREVIRVDAAWFAVEPLDMRAGVDKALARVVDVFGEARAHHAYLFVNKRANRMKVLVHDGFGLWLCARKLYEGSFIRAGVRHDRGMPLSHEQLQAIVVGLPWERLDERAKIRVL